MERAVIYNRCSTEEEAQVNALQVQVQESREIVGNQGWMLVEQYIESQSATTAGKRTEYQRLLADMETNLFDIIVIKSIDRLMRSAMDWYSFIDRLTKNHKRLYIYIDHKFYTPDDSLLTGIKAILAEDFSRELSKKIKNAHKRRQEKQTGYNITVPIFGWNKVSKDVYEINEKEAEAYRLAFFLAEQGMGFYSIANQMYEMGVRGKSGNRISDVQWRNMLYSPRAHGTVRLHTLEYDFEAKQKVKVPESDWIYIENALPPIISKEYHERILKVLESRKKCHENSVFHEVDMTNCDGVAGKESLKIYNNKKMAGQYALSGKLYCGECKAVYYRTVVRGKQGNRIVWKCSTALKYGRKTATRPYGCNNANVEEKWVLRELGNSIRTNYNLPVNVMENVEEEFLSFLRKGICQNHDKNEKRRLEKELKKLKQKKKIILEKLIDGILSDTDFKNLNEDITTCIRKMQNKINDISELEKEYNDYDKRMSHIGEALQGGTIEEAKVRVMLQHVCRITVNSDKKIELQFPKNL